MQKKPTTAIVSTIRDAGATIDSFVNYHLNIGFDYIFLFLDDPRETYADKFFGNDKVIVTPHDDALKLKWKKVKHYARYAGFIGSEVMARQILNAEVAIQLAAQRGVDWLLHLDSDELFYSPARSVREHYLELEARHLRTISYLSYEAAPETPDIGDFFKEVTLFKKNVKILTKAQLKFMRSQKNQDPPGKNSFISHENGKSAGKVSPRLHTYGVHKFSIDGREQGDPPKRLETSPGKFPIILHYPSCGFTAFWTKYRTLGNFSDKWFGQFPVTHPFHLQARDAVAGRNRRSAIRFYKNFIWGKDSSKELLLRKGLLCRITDPSKACNLGK